MHLSIAVVGVFCLVTHSAVCCWHKEERNLYLDYKYKKISTMKILTVKEAVARVNKGERLEGVVLDESTTRQVNVRDALVLSMGGIVIPEQNIYYNDDEVDLLKSAIKEIYTTVLFLFYQKKLLFL
jgi:restriction endonuclease